MGHTQIDDVYREEFVMADRVGTLA